MDLIPRNKVRNEIINWKGEIPVEFLYTAGVSGEIFMDGLKKATLIAGRCDKCRIRFIPPQVFCPDCFSEASSTGRIKGDGRLLSYTILYLNRAGKRLKNPIIIGFIGFPGIKGGILHIIKGIKPDRIKKGLRVKPIFRGHRRGSIKDIIGFKPVH